MFVIPELHLNVHSNVRIPSGRELFNRYGLSSPTGHPDNTDPYKFSDPVNRQANALQKLQSVATRIVRVGRASLYTAPTANEVGHEPDETPSKEGE